MIALSQFLNQMKQNPSELAKTEIARIQEHIAAETVQAIYYTDASVQDAMKAIEKGACRLHVR